MSEQKEGSKESVVTKEEENYIKENFDGPLLYPMSILGWLRRTGEPLNEVISLAVDNPTSPEQKKDWEKAGKFVTENAEKFGIESKNPDQGK